MFRKKTESMSISEFLHGKEKTYKFHPAALAPVPMALAGAGIATPAFASGGASVVNGEAVMVAGHTTKETIMHAFDPLIDMITTISFPIAGVMITGGALMMMVGMKDKGTSMLTQASIGFILVQMAPLFLKILFGIGAAI